MTTTTRVKCEAHRNAKAPACVICLGQEIDRLRAALGQASIYIRWYGPTGIDKDLTVKMIKEALGERIATLRLHGDSLQEER